jgi:hypothetical protein
LNKSDRAAAEHATDFDPGIRSSVVMIGPRDKCSRTERSDHWWEPLVPAVVRTHWARKSFRGTLPKRSADPRVDGCNPTVPCSTVPTSRTHRPCTARRPRTVPRGTTWQPHEKRHERVQGAPQRAAPRTTSPGTQKKRPGGRSPAARRNRSVPSERIPTQEFVTHQAT